MSTQRHPLALALAFAIVLVVFALQAFAEGSSATPSGQQANLIITTDSPRIRMKGKFQPIRGYLSRSATPLRSAAPGQGSAVLSDLVRTPGYYRVYAWWPQNVQGAGQAEMVIRHLRGETSVVVDQRVNGGQWNALGVYELGFGTGAEIEVRAHRGALVIDAFRLEFMGHDLPELTIETAALPIGQDRTPYHAAVTALGTPPYRWSIASGELPGGLTLNATTGEILGTPKTGGRYEFILEVVDAHGRRSARDLSIDVVRSSEQLSTSGTLESPGEIQSFSASGADLSELVAILASTPEGGWVKVNLNSYSDVWTPAELRPLIGPRNPTPASILHAWSSYAWDSNRGELWLYGGGHGNYSGNDVYRWRGTSRRWERASLPSEVKQDDLGNWMAVDGPDRAPVSAHTYDNNIFLPIIDRFLTFGGAAYNNGGAYLRQATETTWRRTGPYLFDPSKADPNKVGGSTGSHVQRVSPFPEIVGGDMWANRDIYVNIPGSPLPTSHVNSCTAYAQENNKDVVYVAARSGGTDLHLYRYAVNDVNNPTLDTWEQVGRFWSSQSNIPACGYDPVRKVFVKRGVNAQPFGYWDLSTPGPTNRDVAFAPEDPTGEFPALLASNALNLKNCGLDFDPIRRNFVLWCADARVWRLTPPATSLSASGWVIERQPTPQGGGVPNGDAGSGTGINGKWKYIDNLDAFLGLQDAVAGNIWLYKPIGWIEPGGSGNARPVVNIVEPANGATFESGQPIVITADATDPDGAIVRVDFFQGSLKLGEDTTPPSPYTFTWNNPPSGTHSLTAVAFDDRGAQTTSPPVTVTVEASAGASVTFQDGLNGYTLTRDTYLSSFHPSLAFGTSPFIYDHRANNYVGLFRFAIFQSEGGPIPDGAIIQSATLSLYKESAYSMTYAVHRLVRDWSEAAATWQQALPGQPWAVPGAAGSGTDYAAVADAQGSVGYDPGWLQFDVTTGIRQMSAGQPNRGWKLVPISGYLNSLKRFHSRDSQVAPALRPKLTVSYSISSP
jgi:hypothetical protein